MRPTEILLHPVRLQVVHAFLGGRSLTTADLRGELPDVPAATLYRQVAALVRGGVLETVGERPVRGAVERTYRLAADAPTAVGAEDARGMSRRDHEQAFLTFALGLVADHDRYLAGDDVDLARDQVGYRRAALDLTDEETARLVADLRAAVAPYRDLPGAPGRRRRILATVLLPTEPAGTSGGISGCRPSSA
ncbi:helix-turn-helix domain-containing protein [Georgenia sp. SUBG003]|uniref:helix-turn-helix domain-containing protein n=1 Tax=Georgenia sp. SUBG003 TaxID=1497974 RepID=UPI0004D4B767|nr:ArsR family transcriptional regulator [Georgenia sp. SUBG003]